ncbi:hypothetical protein HDU67_003856 [Dinochytrium kinnereticum]|nr:hypothetical protein HDU67_003856 [Dinochytrium kinnereticum]
MVDPTTGYMHYQNGAQATYNPYETPDTGVQNQHAYSSPEGGYGYAQQASAYVATKPAIPLLPQSAYHPQQPSWNAGPQDQSSSRSSNGVSSSTAGAMLNDAPSMPVFATTKKVVNEPNKKQLTGATKCVIVVLSLLVLTGVGVGAYFATRPKSDSDSSSLSNSGSGSGSAGASSSISLGVAASSSGSLASFINPSVSTRRIVSASITVGNDVVPSVTDFCGVVSTWGSESAAAWDLATTAAGTIAITNFTSIATAATVYTSASFSASSASAASAASSASSASAASTSASTSTASSHVNPAATDAFGNQKLKYVPTGLCLSRELNIILLASFVIVLWGILPDTAYVIV